MTNPYFNQDTFTFLKNLAANNNREWFQENKQAYEERVRTPALAFIDDMAYDLAMISPHFLALPKKVGGSLMRVHRDTRFGKDKRPYKTNIGIQFRHEMGKDVHAPGYYVHIEPGSCFLGVGIWRPDSLSLSKIRQAIDEQGETWLAICNNKTFQKHYKLEGESLTNPPRGYPKEHPLIEDLKRKDFIGIYPLSEKNVQSKTFRQRVSKNFESANAYMAFLCKALELRF